MNIFRAALFHSKTHFIQIKCILKQNNNYTIRLVKNVLNDIFKENF